MAYTVSDITSGIQDDLGDPNFSSPRILRYMNRGQQLIFATHLFRFCEKIIEGDLTIGEHTYEQQSDHQSTIGGSVTDPSNTDSYFLLNEESYMQPDDFFQAYPNPENNDRGMPTKWTEYGDQVYFNCPVDKAYTFKQRYYKVPASLVNPTDVPTVPEEFRETLEDYILYRSEKRRGNHDIAATYKQDYEDGLEAMVFRYTGNHVAPAVMAHARS